MIEVTNLRESSDTAEVSPSDDLFLELGKNTYDYKDLISELIDNCSVSRHA